MRGQRAHLWHVGTSVTPASFGLKVCEGWNTFIVTALNGTLLQRPESEVGSPSRAEVGPMGPRRDPDGPPKRPHAPVLLLLYGLTWVSVTMVWRRLQSSLFLEPPQPPPPPHSVTFVSIYIKTKQNSYIQCFFHEQKTIFFEGFFPEKRYTMTFGCEKTR